MKRIGVGIIILLISIAGCKEDAKKQEKIVPVKTITVKPKDIFSYVSVMGIVDSKVHTWIKSTTEGFVKSLAVKEGSYVHEGQIVCYIMPIDSQNMLGQAKLEFDRAKRDYENADGPDKETLKLRFEEAGKMLESSYSLYKPVPAVSPVSGVVLSKTVENGSMVSVKQNLVEIADLQKLIIRASLAEELISNVKIGDSITAIIQNDGKDIKIKGRITTITFGVNPMSKTTGVEIYIPANRILKPGMTAVVDFITNRRSGAIVVPLESILLDYQGSKKVFIVKNGKAIEKRVVTGIEANTEVEVQQGLAFGDELIVLGQENCKNGLKVNFAKPQPGKNKSNKITK